MLGRFTTFEIAKALDLKYGRLREWIDRGYIRPSIHKARRQGEKSLFSLADAYAIKLFVYLLARGFARQDAALRIQALQMGDSTLLSMPYVAFYRQEGLEGADAVSLFIPDDPKDPSKTITFSLCGKTADGRDVEFDDAFILNFKKIRNRVDQALA